jgi:hypothetical protein
MTDCERIMDVLGECLAVKFIWQARSAKSWMLMDVVPKIAVPAACF